MSATPLPAASLLAPAPSASGETHSLPVPDTRAVGVVGCGVVGQQVSLQLVRAGWTVYVHDTAESAMANVIRQAPAGTVHATTTVDTLGQRCHTLCLALPTPVATTEAHTGHDVSALETTLSRLHTLRFPGPVLLMSTLCPGATEELATAHAPLALFHVPEFLSSRTAHLDTVVPLQPLLLVGAPKAMPAAMVERVRLFLAALASRHQQVLVVQASESEATKLFCNAFYAAKLQLFNEFYRIAQHKGFSYEMVRHLMLQQGWVHPMHTQVPGADGREGVGGACLPKDSQALSQWVERNGPPCPLLGALSAV